MSLTTVEVSQEVAQELGNLKVALERYAYAPKGQRQNVTWESVTQAQDALRGALMASPVTHGAK